MMGRLKLSAIMAVLGSAWLLPAGGAEAAPGYTVLPAGYRSTVQFAVTYRGSGSWHTVYHSEPPDGGGAHDTNDAHDSSTQLWSLRFTRPLTVSGCRHKGGCMIASSLEGATGTTSATGSIDHTHLDGLYAFDNASEHCLVGAVTPPPGRLPATMLVRYLPRRRAISLTALSPVDDVLTLLPVACPGQGDPLDGLEDNYFSPGFSFASGYGADRWFTSAPVVVPLAVLHRAARIKLHFSDTTVGTPPATCAVQQPSYETCRTGGSWSGTIELTAVQH
jgi:hypothetical protein